MASPQTITVTLSQIAKLIDHSLLHPTLTDDETKAGLATARNANVATACVKPYMVPGACAALKGSAVKVCAVAGFPAGNSTIATKVTEAIEAVLAGAHEIDVVVNVGKVLSGDWAYVAEEIRAVNEAVTGLAVVDGEDGEKGVLKVIFETDYIQDEHIVKLCEICTEARVAFVKTSTGFGFVKQKDGSYAYRGATVPHLRLMRECCPSEVQVKAAGGVRTLDDFLTVMSLGVTRVGATATVAILEEAKRRGITEVPKEVELKNVESIGGGAC